MRAKEYRTKMRMLQKAVKLYTFTSYEKYLINNGKNQLITLRQLENTKDLKKNVIEYFSEKFRDGRPIKNTY